MNVMRTVMLGASAAFIAAAVSVIVFLGTGIFGPMWLLTAIYGTKATEDSPGHGGAVLLITLPLAGVLSIVTFAVLTINLYRYLSGWLVQDASSPR